MAGQRGECLHRGWKARHGGHSRHWPEVRLNDKDLGILWTAPWRIDVTDLLRSQGNRLEVRVTNGWTNRLIGDRKPENKDVRKVSWPSGLLGGKEHPAGRHTFVTHHHYR